MKRNVGFTRRLRKYYGLYTLTFAFFVVALAIGESLGLSERVIGHVFLFVTIAIYATIGVMSRTSDVSEYYVAGRRVPAVFNGMATAADWMSAASFIGLAGTLYFSGFEGLAFVTGWTGGFVLVALLLAPYLRKFGQYTIPDFLGARYQGNVARLVGLAAAVLASFVYLVAQIYGVGLVTSRFVSVEFEIGLFIGLAGILVCSFLGGMRAVTWTQVAQYVILIIAYLVPVVILPTSSPAFRFHRRCTAPCCSRSASGRRCCLPRPRSARCATCTRRRRTTTRRRSRPFLIHSRSNARH